MNFIKVTLPKASKVVILEDSDMRIEWFKKRIPNLTVTKTVEEFIEIFTQEHRPSCDFIFLDHDLGQENGKTGLDAARFMSENFGRGGKFTLVHSWNKDGAQRMVDVLRGAMYLPFGDFELEVEN